MEVFDLLVVGGGINGVGIARDAAGRGLSVLLVEQGDLGSATSSASSKLIHGGLRYLEQLELRLVAESLAEREVLLRAAPHIVRPLRFVMPHAADLRPRWMIRTGLLLYDWLARRQTLPSSMAVPLNGAPYGQGLKPSYIHGYVYSDCWVDDARLVIANARAAADAGARIQPRTSCLGAHRLSSRWRVRLAGSAGEEHVESRVLVNAAGRWAGRFLTLVLGDESPAHVRLVQGSHIVVPRLYEGDYAYILQNDDRRVVFVYPYEGAYTLVGTTDVELSGEPRHCGISAEEVQYLCRAANRYFVRGIDPADVKWSYCGVRALVDDRTRDPAKMTRDYLLRLDGGQEEPPLLSVFGGKITTYRRLAERAISKLAPWLPQLKPRWTAEAYLPGGDIPQRDVVRLTEALAARYSALSRSLVAALVRRHGARAADVLDSSRTDADLGVHFGADLYAKEVDYFITHEWARNGDDVLWRRTKAGLHLTPAQQVELCRYVAARCSEPL